MRHHNRRERKRGEMLIILMSPPRHSSTRITSTGEENSSSFSLHPKSNHYERGKEESSERCSEITKGDKERVHVWGLFFASKVHIDFFIWAFCVMLSLRSHCCENFLWWKYLTRLKAISSFPDELTIRPCPPSSSVSWHFLYLLCLLC